MLVIISGENVEYYMLLIGWHQIKILDNLQKQFLLFTQ